MPQTIEHIKENERYEYTGDVHVTGSIGKGAQVTIQDGSLTIDGDVENGAKIELKQKANEFASNVVMGRVIINGVTVSGSNQSTLTISGMVGDGVHVIARNSNYVIKGSIGNECKLETHNGNIITKAIGANTFINSYNGNISSQEVNEGSLLETYNGNVVVDVMKEASKAKTYNGNITAKQADKSAVLETKNGSIYGNGVRRKQESKSAEGIYISDMTISIGNRKVIVNGVEVTPSVSTNNGTHSYHSYSISNQALPLEKEKAPQVALDTKESKNNHAVEVIVNEVKKTKKKVQFNLDESAGQPSTRSIDVKSTVSYNQQQPVEAKDSKAERQISESKKRIAEVLQTLKNEIERAAADPSNLPSAIRRAERLHSDLLDKQSDFETGLNASNFKNKMAEFKKDCSALINEAKPELEKKLGWGNFLNQLLKTINALINALTCGAMPSFFKPKKTELSKAAERVEEQIGENKGAKNS